METELRVGARRGQSPSPRVCPAGRAGASKGGFARIVASVGRKRHGACVNSCPRQGRGCPPQGPSSRGSEFLVTGSGSLPGRLGLGDAEPLLSRTLAGFPLLSAARVFGRRSENVLSLDSFPPVPFVGKAISAVVSINTVYGVKVFPARFAGQSRRFLGKSRRAAEAARAQVSGAL